MFSNRFGRITILMALFLSLSVPCLSADTLLNADPVERCKEILDYLRTGKFDQAVK